MENINQWKRRVDLLSTVSATCTQTEMGGGCKKAESLVLLIKTPSRYLSCTYISERMYPYSIFSLLKEY